MRAIPHETGGLLTKLPQSSRSGWPWSIESSKVAEDVNWPTITVVMPSFRHVRFIEEAVRSVILQNYPRLEFFVMDGLSNDGTAEILKQYEPWISHWRSERDKGQADAIARGFEMGTGSILTWINSDDFLAPNALFSAAKAFVESGADIVIGQCRVEGRLHGPSALDSFADFLKVRSRWMTGEYIVQPECFFTRKIYNRAGGLDTQLNYAMDAELWTRFARAGARIVRIQTELATLRRHEAQKTFDWRPATAEHVKAVSKQLIDGWNELGDAAPCVANELFDAALFVATSYGDELRAIKNSRTFRLARLIASLKFWTTKGR